MAASTEPPFGILSFVILPFVQVDHTGTILSGS